MRIIINGWFVDRPHTGSGQYTLQLLKHLPQVAPQHEYALVVPNKGSFKIHDITVDTDFPSLVSNLKRPASDFRKVLFEQSIMPRAARAYEADVLHVPYWAPPLRSSVPIVVTIHDIIPLILPQYRGGPLVRAYTQLASAAARGATLIVTDSDASRSDIIEHLRIPADRVRTIYLAADSEFSDHLDPIDTAALHKNYDLPEEYVLYLGGFDARKNVEALLQVYTWAQDVLGESYPLVIAGSLPDQHNKFFHDPRVIARQIEVESGRCIGRVAEEDRSLCINRPARSCIRRCTRASPAGTRGVGVRRARCRIECLVGAGDRR
jgi:glycosyltransferase involved in cell wall biosynthesis